MSAQTSSTEPDNDLPGQIALLMLQLVGMLLILPLVIPIIATAIAGERIATKARFWSTLRGHWIANVAGVLIIGAILLLEALLLRQWIADSSSTFTSNPDWPAQLLPLFGPWALLNLTSGVLLLPLAWSVHRRRINQLVRKRRVRDVILQSRIETARKRANDSSAAARIGVNLDRQTGRITGITGDAVTGPLPLEDGSQAFGVVARGTVTSLEEHFIDARRVRDWIDPTGRYAVLPRTASAVRALLIAESGSGKTVFLNAVVLAALEYGWPVFLIDAKGDPQDAEALVAQAQSYGHTAIAGGTWNLFSGTAAQVTDKLMRLMPAADGANQHYLDEIRGVLQAVQDTSPIRGVEDLRERLTNPGPHVRDSYDMGMVNAPVDRSGTATAGTRSLQSLLVALRPLEEWIDSDGWTYDKPGAGLTVVPLSPVDDAQARLGDLLLLDLRHFLTTRLARRDKSPVVVIVDEFPQLVTGTSDPGDTAGSLFETARSAGVGLVLATQSPAGLSNDDIRRRRALTSGAALIFGRSKDPEDVVKYAGTVMQMEASGSAGGEELRSGRAQHTFVIPPQDVREASDGSFWVIQGGAGAQFRALPNRAIAAFAPAPVVANDLVEELDEEQSPSARL